MADELIDRAFDREIWQSDDDVVCVVRERAGTASSAAFAFTFAGFAALGAIGCLLAILLAGEHGNWFIATTALAVIAIALFKLGFQFVAEDRAIRALPIREVPHLVVSKGTVTFMDGTQVPPREVFLEVVVADYGENDRHQLILNARDRSIVVMHAAYEAGLDRAREVLRRAGLGADRYQKPPAP